MKQQQILSLLAVAFVMSGLGFFGGMKYQESKSPFGTFENRQRTFQNGQRTQGRTGMMPVNGEIISQDATSITVKLQDGSSKIVILSKDTIINKTEKTSKTDLKTGTVITAFGTTNSDGSLTAQTVSIGNSFQRGMMRQDTEQPKN